MTKLDILHVGDARNLHDLTALADSSVDVTVTSPPYWNRKDYGTGQQIGFGQTLEDYLNDVQRVFAQCYSLTKNTGSLWLIADDYREANVLHLLPWALSERARNVGWIMRDLIIWDKQRALPFHGTGQMRNVTEFILFMTKTNEYKHYVDRVKVIDELSKWWVDFPERFNPKGKTPTNIWTFPITTQGKWCKPSKLDHECPFPPGLIARILEIATDEGDVVLDPFAGSGVTLAQASAMGRYYIGTEINPQFVQMFNETVLNEVAEEWHKQKEFRANHGEAFSSQDFERNIMSLRALKYARQVSKPFTGNAFADRENILTIFCLAQVPTQFQREHSFAVTVWILLSKNSLEATNALQEAIRRSNQPPLSQYGITGDIRYGTVQDLEQYLAGLDASVVANLYSVKPSGNCDSLSCQITVPCWCDLQLYLYPDAKPRKYSQENTVASWLACESPLLPMNDKRIPMLSNIQVDVAWIMEND